jgi:hypothetical protein
VPDDDRDTRARGWSGRNWLTESPHGDIESATATERLLLRQPPTFLLLRFPEVEPAVRRDEETTGCERGLCSPLLCELWLINRCGGAMEDEESETRWTGGAVATDNDELKGGAVAATMARQVCILVRSVCSNRKSSREQWGMSTACLRMLTSSHMSLTFWGHDCTNAAKDGQSARYRPWSPVARASLQHGLSQQHDLLL